MSKRPSILVGDIIFQPNARAKRLRLRSVQGKIYLTIPPSATAAQISAFLQQSEQWLAQQRHQQGTSFDLENSLSINLVNQTWSVKTSNEITHWITNPDERTILLPKEKAVAQLTAWTMSQAKQYLPERLAQHAHQHHFSYRQCRVRHARTRWGSCNHQGDISLNAGLLLLPQSALDYVLLHELCHTRHLNHSAAFWAEMSQVDPNYQQHRQQIKQFRWPSWWSPSKC